MPLSSLPGIGLGRAAGRGIPPPSSNSTIGSAAHGLSGPVRGMGKALYNLLFHI